MAGTKPTGHLQVKGQRGERAWYALWRDGEGRHQRKIAPAWVKDSGERTARGAVIWRAAPGSKPSDEHLTPKEAQERLQALLAAAPKGSSSAQRQGRTFGDAVDEWLRWCEHEKGVAPSTLRGYRQLAKGHLEPAFGRDTPLRRVTTARIDEYRERLAAGKAKPTRLSSMGARTGPEKPSPRTQQSVMAALHAVLKRAKRKGWVATNAAEDVERVKLRRSGDFNVLEPAQVEAVARAAGDGAGQLIRVAAYTGLRLGELRSLRWRDADFTHAVVHVRRSAPTSAPTSGPQIKAPKSGKVRSVPMTDPAAKALELLSRRERWTGPDDLVFPSPTGGLFDGGRVRSDFYAALGDAGMGALRDKEDPFTFHDLRHTFGSLAVRVAPLAEVQAWMGHANIQTTMGYAHWIPQNDAASRLSAAFIVDTTVPDESFTAALAG